MLKGKGPLLIALALAGLAVALVLFQLKAYKREATAGWELKDVVVAALDLPPGAALNANAIKLDKMPAKFIYESVLVPADTEFALGREVAVPIKRGEPIHWYQLRGVRALEHLSKAVRKQGRAVSIGVTERAAVGHWVRPNDHVDVLGTFRDPNANELSAVTLLQDIIVLATGQTTGATQGPEVDTRYSTVTLLVDPEEAEILVLAQELGSLYLTLRNAEDTNVFDEDKRGRTTIATLMTGERLKQARQRRRDTIQVIRGPSGASSGR